MVTGLRCLSLHQPWASLVAVGVKTIETRSWATKHRGRIGIASTAKKPKPGLLVGHDWMVIDCALEHRVYALEHYASGCEGAPRDVRLPLGALVATANLVDCVPIVGWEGDREKFPAPPFVVRGWEGRDILIQCRYSREIDRSDQLPYGDFAPGRWAWLLDDVKPTTERCPACEGAGRVADRRPEARRSFGYPVEWRECPTCDGNGKCDPIPVKGHQRLWEWTP